MEIDGWIFNLVQRGLSLVIVDPESGEELGGEWIGQWSKVDTRCA
jgi:hypothetical protein